jgi:hypothetical protein
MHHAIYNRHLQLSGLCDSLTSSHLSQYYPHPPLSLFPSLPPGYCRPSTTSSASTTTLSAATMTSLSTTTSLGASASLPPCRHLAYTADAVLSPWSHLLTSQFLSCRLSCPLFMLAVMRILALVGIVAPLIVVPVRIP